MEVVGNGTYGQVYKVGSLFFYVLLELKPLPKIKQAETEVKTLHLCTPPPSLSSPLGLKNMFITTCTPPLLHLGLVRSGLDYP